MRAWQPGDKLVSPILGKTWMYVGTVGEKSYLVPCEGAPDAEGIAIPLPVSEMEDWEIAPEPFFEEGKGYQFGDGMVVTVWHVVELANGPAAIGQSTNGTPCMMTSYSGWREVK